MFSMTSGLLAQNSLNGWAIQVLLSHSILSRIEKNLIFSNIGPIITKEGVVLILYSFPGVFSIYAQSTFCNKARQKIKFLLCSSCARI
jgi:hypothetical protein